MHQDVAKICADSLRTFSKDKYDIKLKAAHAHELVAAYFGYKSRRAMKAENKFPMNNLHLAELVIMIPDDFIDQRRKNLQELSPELPDSYTLGEEVYAPLFAGELWTSQYPPFRSFKALAEYLVENNAAYQSVFKFHLEVLPMQHVVVVEESVHDVTLSVLHTSEVPNKDSLVSGNTIITLPRVAGRIGFGKPKILPGIWTGGARRTLESLGVQP